MILLAGSASAIVAAQTRCAGAIWIVIVVLNFCCHNFCLLIIESLTTQNYYSTGAWALRN